MWVLEDIAVAISDELGRVLLGYLEASIAGKSGTIKTKALVYDQRSSRKGGNRRST